MTTLLPFTAISENPATTANTRLQGGWLWVARISWGVVTALTWWLFVASHPANLARLRTICISQPCTTGQITPAGVAALVTAGFSLEGYVAWNAGITIFAALVYTASALLIVLRRSDEWLALLAGLMLITFSLATFTDAARGLADIYPFWWLPTQLIGFLGDLLFILFILVFPSGRFVPRWTGWLLGIWFITRLPHYFFDDSIFNLADSLRWLYDILFLGGLFGGVGAQVYRFWRVSNAAERLQTKWVVFGLLTAILGFVTCYAFYFRLPDPNGGDIMASLALNSIGLTFMLLIPVTLSIAVLRHRLWQIDPIINRTLLYGALTLIVVSLYVILVGGLGALFQTRGNFVISVLATGVAAMLFEPLRNQLQRGINRLMYGERDDPYAVISRLSQRLGSTLAPEAVLPTIVETVAQALKLPLVEAVVQDKVTRWQGGKVTVIPADSSLVTPSPLHLVTLSYQGEPVGELRLAPRAPGESFSPADRQLLHDLAQQAGIAIHALRLTLDLQRLNADLQRSREGLVTALEEERRRLRRDLHDGLGPQLASQALKLEALHDLIRTRPARAEALVDELIAKSQETIADVRQVVYALRPPALDQFGLLGAIAEYARQCESDNTRITVCAPEQLPPLSAAVEVAAYRIIQEALTNVIRHAQAQSAEVRIALTEGETALQLTISDDGIGLPPTHHPGVGLHSMGERAAELGGECRVEAQPEGGTQVYAQLPLNPRGF